MSEAALKQSIRLSVGREPDVKLFNNPVGVGWVGKVIRRTKDTVTLAMPRQISYGLFKGSADTVGYHTVTVTHEMVGQRIAVFASIEVKYLKGTLSPEQETWLAVTRAGGCLTGVARSVADARTILRLPT